MKVVIPRVKRSRAYGIAFVLAALFMLGGAAFFAEMVWESHASAAWPHVPGVIVSSYTDRTCGGARTTLRWEAKVVYEYRVEGRSYQSGRVSNMRVYCDRDRQATLAWLKAHFPVGGPVEVYYNAADPQSAFLHPGVVSKIDVAMIFALLVVSALMALGAFLSFRRQSPAPAPLARRSVRLSFRIGPRTDKHD